MQRDSVVIYRSFYEAINSLPEEEQPNAYRAVFEYAFNGKIVEMSVVTAAMFRLIQPQLDANNRRYQNGLRGGRKPKHNQNETKVKPKANQSVTKTEPNVNVNVNDNENVKYDPESIPYKCAIYLDRKISEHFKAHKPSKETSLQNWALEFDRANRIDERPWEDVKEVLTWLCTSEHKDAAFWRGNIKSGAKFREHFETLANKMQMAGGDGDTPEH